jgi:tetratricopeptide (TPR) repeat protein
MRRPLLLPALLLLALVVPANPQAPAAQSTPETLTTAYNLAMQLRDWPAAEIAARKLLVLSGSSQNLCLLANAQINGGIALRDSAAIEAALDTYNQAIAAAQQQKPAQGQPDAGWKDNLAKIFIAKGNALLKLHRDAGAVEAYNHSAEFAANPGKAYFDVCATLYNSGDMHDAAAACRKSLQADSSGADAWFILGSVLFVDATADANGKFVISAEARRALEKYLLLAPNGPHAPDVKQMLDAAAK